MDWIYLNLSPSLPHALKKITKATPIHFLKISFAPSFVHQPIRFSQRIPGINSLILSLLHPRQRPSKLDLMNAGHVLIRPYSQNVLLFIIQLYLLAKAGVNLIFGSDLTPQLSILDNQDAAIPIPQVTQISDLEVIIDNVRQASTQVNVTASKTRQMLARVNGPFK